MKKKDDLLNFSEGEYGEDLKRHLLEQYKIYIESADKISDRRQKNNDFFLAMNTALIAFLGYLIKEQLAVFSVVFLVSLVGMALCYFWYRLIRSYKDINSGKFRVVHRIEKKLPFSFYDVEWQELGEGKDKKKYLPFTHIEINIPWVFMVFYLFIFITNIPWAIICDLLCE